jgi:hypothetical protein
MQPRRKKTLCDNPLLLRFEEISQQQKKAEDELRSRPKKSHPAKFSKKVETSKTSEMSKTEAIRQSKLAVAAALSRGALNNVRCSSKELVNIGRIFQSLGTSVCLLYFNVCFIFLSFYSSVCISKCFILFFYTSPKLSLLSCYVCVLSTIK